MPRPRHPAVALARFLIVLAVATAGLTVPRAAEIFVAAHPPPDCPCGNGNPPAQPCGTTADRPLGCWADAYARAGGAGDIVTFLPGDHEACLAIDGRGRWSAPFTIRGATADGVSIRCRQPVDTVRVTGGAVVIEDLRIVADKGTPGGLHLAPDIAGRGGRHTLRRVVVEGGQNGVVVEGSGHNQLDDVTIDGSLTGLQIVSDDNQVRGLSVRDCGASGVLVAPAAARNRIEGFEVRDSGLIGLLVMSGARDNRFEDGLVSGSGGQGIEIGGSGTVVLRCDVNRARIHGIHVMGRGMTADGVRIESCNVHHNGNLEGKLPEGDGIKIEVASRTTVRATRVTANISNGIAEGDTRATLIEDCDIEGNGTSMYAHGVYTKGEGGVIRGCRVRGNSGYGLHLWAAPADYLVEDNEVTGNGTVGGGGIVVGGTPTEAMPGHSGLPENVVVRRNRLVGNLGPALDYLLPVIGQPEGCWPGSGGNEFLDNDITTIAGTLPIRVRGSRPECVTVRGNVVRAPLPPATPPP